MSQNIKEILPLLIIFSVSNLIIYITLYLFKINNNTKEFNHFIFLNITIFISNIIIYLSPNNFIGATLLQLILTIFL